jgi:hypothetical protein
MITGWHAYLWVSFIPLIVCIQDLIIMQFLILVTFYIQFLIFLRAILMCYVDSASSWN